MQALRVDVEGDFNSFRMGQSLQYQRTYIFPPKPTLIGLLGASLGLEDIQLAPLYKDVMTGVILFQHHGTARDLWGITKIKSGIKAEHAVVMRDILYRPTYRIFFALSKKNPVLNLPDLEASFTDPAYPLTLGRSDELVLVRTHEVTNLKPTSEGACFRYTVLPFDYRRRKCDLEKVTESNSGIIELPQVYKLPVEYSYDKNRKRSVTRYGTFTHIFGTRVTLNEDVEGGWCDGDTQFFLY